MNDVANREVAFSVAVKQAPTTQVIRHILCLAQPVPRMKELFNMEAVCRPRDHRMCLSQVGPSTFKRDILT